MNVLDKGFVNLIDHMGSDYRVEQAAKISFGNLDDKPAINASLINYLERNQHGSPFEHVLFTFHVKCPIFVMRQWIRHRIASYNEISARYKELEAEFYIPEQSRINLQSTNNKQGSSSEVYEDPNSVIEDITMVTNCSYAAYQELLEKGIAKELARTILPLSIYTEFIWTINLRSLFNFLKLRTDSHAQKEIRDYANAIYDLVEPIVPKSIAAFNNYTKNAKVIPADIWEQVKNQIDFSKIKFNSKTEKEDFSK